MNRRIAVGIDIGGTNTVYGFIDEAGTVGPQSGRPRLPGSRGILGTTMANVKTQCTNDPKWES